MLNIRKPYFRRRPLSTWRVLVSACVVCLCLIYFDGTLPWLTIGAESTRTTLWSSSKQAIRLLVTVFGCRKTLAYWQDSAHEDRTSHPINQLVQAAQLEFDQSLRKQTHTLRDAAAAYRIRRGRHPPPGFDDWFNYANQHNAVLVEDFWDQIYHDLDPFWAIPAPKIRKDAWDFEMTISVRNHTAASGSDWFWTQIWLRMIKAIEHLLPDLDIAINAMDEPRMVVPWEQMAEYMDAAQMTRRLPDVAKVVKSFQPLPSPGNGPDRLEPTSDKNWENTKPYWLVARSGCAPDSNARKASLVQSFNVTPEFGSSFGAPHMRGGFVSNYTLSTDFCHQSDLQALNGIFVEPLTISATKCLFPLFGGSKLAVNNDILLPSPMYWSNEERFTGGDSHGGPWSSKQNRAVWRGVASGGRHSTSNWRAFQRHRFVAMNNKTELGAAELDADTLRNFALPSRQYGLAAQVQVGALAHWVESWADVAFVDLLCEDATGEPSSCDYAGSRFHVRQAIALSEQFKSKYLPDIDGNSFSGRYLGFLRSTSTPIKATVWREWHDSRLVAWKHFVPMDNGFGDWFGIMEYFLGYGDDVAGHDDVAERIASDGKAWAEKVLRKEDMQIYVHRLLLEYARVCDERRESMGWVEDLVSVDESREG